MHRASQVWAPWTINSPDCPCSLGSKLWIAWGRTYEAISMGPLPFHTTFWDFLKHILRIFWDCFRISSHLRRWPCLLLTCGLDPTWKYLNFKIGSRFFKGKELSHWKCECPKWIDEKCKKKEVEKTTLNVQSSLLNNH